ncbi:vesicle transport protein SFT2C [Rhynchocyon petersi]
MAEAHSQLQEYLEQTKAGKPGAATPLLTQGQAATAAGDSAKAGLWPGAGRRWTWAWAPVNPTAGSAPCLPGVSRAQRLAASGACLLLAALCFGLAALCAPTLLLRARRFALLWSLGSALALVGGALLWGGVSCAWLLAGKAPSRPALLYAASLGATLYAALVLRSAALTVLAAGAQMCALFGLLLGLLPWGSGSALRLALGRLNPGAGLVGLPV